MNTYRARSSTWRLNPGDVDVAVRRHSIIGESPVWDARRRTLFWVDIDAGLLHCFNPKAAINRSVQIGRGLSAVVLGEAGLALAIQNRIEFRDSPSVAARRTIAIERRLAGNRTNECKADPHGRLWVGTMSEDRAPGTGTLYCVELLGDTTTVTPVVAPVSISNGIDWSLDGRLMYFIDSPTMRLDVFDYDRASGALTNRRPLVIFSPDRGCPDGLTLDDDGFIWVAFYGGGSVRRYAPDGTLDGEIDMPVTLVTSCAFGGPDLMDLYITTASNRLTDEERHHQPLAGSLFRCRPGIRGRESKRFAGRS